MERPALAFGGSSSCDVRAPTGAHAAQAERQRRASFQALPSTEPVWMTNSPRNPVPFQVTGGPLLTRSNLKQARLAEHAQSRDNSSCRPSHTFAKG